MANFGHFRVRAHQEINFPSKFSTGWNSHGCGWCFVTLAFFGLFWSKCHFFNLAKKLKKLEGKLFSRWTLTRKWPKLAKKCLKNVVLCFCPVTNLKSDSRFWKLWFFDMKNCLFFWFFGQNPKTAFFGQKVPFFTFWSYLPFSNVFYGLHIHELYQIF